MGTADDELLSMQAMIPGGKVFNVDSVAPTVKVKDVVSKDYYSNQQK